MCIVVHTELSLICKGIEEFVKVWELVKGWERLHASACEFLAINACANIHVV